MSGTFSAFLPLIIVFLAVGTLVSTAAFVLSATGIKLKINRRLKRVAADAGKTEGDRAFVPVSGGHSSIAWFDAAIQRWLPRPEHMREKLTATGKRIRLGEYVLFCLVTAAFTDVTLHSFLPTHSVAVLLFSIAAGAGIPHLAVNLLIKRRINRFMVQFPEAIDLMVRGIRAGLPITECMRAAGQEMADPVGIEFRRVIDALKLGFTLNQALLATQRRLRSPDFHFFIISLAVQQETGGNLAETLDNLGNLLRKRKQMKLKIRAMSSEARASAMIIGSLPIICFFGLLLFKPDYMMIMLTDPRGHMLLAGSVLSMLTGAGMMMKLARFEI